MISRILVSLASLASYAPFFVSPLLDVTLWSSIYPSLFIYAILVVLSLSFLIDYSLLLCLIYHSLLLS